MDPKRHRRFVAVMPFLLVAIRSVQAGRTAPGFDNPGFDTYVNKALCAWGALGLAIVKVNG